MCRILLIFLSFSMSFGTQVNLEQESRTKLLKLLGYSKEDLQKKVRRLLLERDLYREDWIFCCNVIGFLLEMNSCPRGTQRTELYDISAERHLKCALDWNLLQWVGNISKSHSVVSFRTALGMLDQPRFIPPDLKLYKSLLVLHCTQQFSF